MAAHDAFDLIVDRNQFLQQVVIHHRRGDHYPDPQVISRELHFTSGQIDAVLSGLRTLRWIADSPYGSERLRLTPRCWSFLQRVSRIPDSVPTTFGEDANLIQWQPADATIGSVAIGQMDAVATLVE
jgi:hypothetical protein